MGGAQRSERARGSGPTIQPSRSGGIWPHRGGNGCGTVRLAASFRESALHLPRGLLKLQSIEPMKEGKALTIRSYRASDRGVVRRLCCQTGFLGDPIDPVYQDHELFADFLTSYYTDKEPE